MRLFIACVVLSLAAQASTTINTTITVSNAAASFSGSSLTATGPVSLTNIGSGTFNATLSIQGGQNFTGPFTITLTGSPTVGSAGDTITGTVTVSANILGGTGSGSAAITGGTGAFANATGSIPDASGSGMLTGTSAVFGFDGSGTITIGGSSGPPPPVVPTITQVSNNYSYTPSGFPNSGIAQGTLFTVFGTGLADPNAQALPLQAPANGLPTTLNGSSVKVTVNGTTTTPVFYYAIASQIALVLPSSTPVGNGQVTVTYNGQSASAPIQVVSTAMGFDSYYGTGAGLAVVTNNSTGEQYSYTDSIPPTTVVALWGSGLGADPTRDTTFVTPPFAINSLAHVYVGGIDAPIAYQGASGYPGLNQIVVTIPANAPTGCNVSLVGVTAAGVPTNFLALPIGSGVCSDPEYGITGTDYQNLSGETTVKTGFVGLGDSVRPADSGIGTQTDDIAIASFDKQSGSSYVGGGGGGIGSISIPGCSVTETPGTGGGTSTETGLDAGTITVTGPTGNATLTGVPQELGTYVAQLASGFIPTSGGSFAFSNGAGGADVGSFNTTVSFPNPILSWTNQATDATVTQASGVLFTWTGGTPGTFVIMTGNSSGTVNGQSSSGSFTCIAAESALQFQVPNYVTSALPPGTGTLQIANYTNFQSFTATGIDRGYSVGYSQIQINTTFQ